MMRTRFLLFKAFIGLILYDLLVRNDRFASLHGHVRRWQVASCPASPELIARAQHAVDLACLWYPKPVLCLQRSVIATCLLRRVGAKAELIIGAQRLPFRSHAWVEIDGRVINDKSDMRKRYLILERI
jgi:hypothetical protein